MPLSRNTIILGLMAVLAGAGVALSMGETGHGSHGQDLAAIQDELHNAHAMPVDFRSIPDFSLINQHNKPVDQSLFEGQWSMVFFGFTHCPDVCPASLVAMQGFVQELEAAGEALPQIVFVSIDPKRDTPELMQPFLNYFHPDFIGVTGDFNKINALTDALGVVAEFTANPEIPDSYTINHTASIFMVDPQKRIRGKFDMPHEPDTMTQDYLILRTALAEPS